MGQERDMGADVVRRGLDRAGRRRAPRGMSRRAWARGPIRGLSLRGWLAAAYGALIFAAVALGPAACAVLSHHGAGH